MTRSHRRISRFLLIALTATIALGLATHYYKYRRGTTATPLAADQVIKVESRTAVALPQAVEHPTPAPAPQVQISAPALPAAPATKPAPVVTVTPAAAAVAPQPAPKAAIDISPAQSNPLADAKAKWDKGDLLGTRKILNEALVAGNLSAEDKTSARTMLADAGKALVFSPRIVPTDPFVSAYSVKIGERLSKIASDHNVTWEFLGRINNLSDPKKLRAGKTLKIVEGPFHAVVTKSTYMMDLYLGEPGKSGGVLVASYPVGLGQDDSTPTGVWMVEPQHKLKKPTYYSPRGEGVIESSDPKNPLGPCWIGLTGTDGRALGQLSYGIHGTNDPGSVGKQSSLGCIRLRNEDALLVYDMLVEGKSIVTVKD